MPAHRSFAWIVPPAVVTTLPALAWLVAGPPAAVGLLLGPEAAGGMQLHAPLPPIRVAALVQDVPGSGQGGNPPVSALTSVPACATVPDLSTAGQSLNPREDLSRSEQRQAHYRVAGVLSADGTIAGWELTARASGSTIRVALPPESAARGPIEGLIAVASDDGSRSEIHVVAPASGCANLVHTSADVVRQAIVAPDGSGVLFHAVGRNDRLDQGIWRSALDGSQAVPVLPPLTPADPFLADVGLVWSTELRTDSDGAWLAAESCGAEVCRTRIAGLGSERAPEPRALPGRIVGLDRRSAITMRSCDGPVCALFSTELASGQERRLVDFATSATTVVVGGRLHAAAIVEHGPPSLVLVDPTSGSQRWTGALGPGMVDASSLEPTLQLLPEGGTAAAGAEVPPGWVPATTAAGGLVALDAARIGAAPAGESSR